MVIITEVINALCCGYREGVRGARSGERRSSVDAFAMPWCITVMIVGEELRHFWQGVFERMSVPRGHTPLSKHTKIGVQDTTGRGLFELFQECNSHFHSGQMLRITLAAQPVGGRGARLNGHPGYALQIRTPVQHLGGLTPRAIQEYERRHSRRQPRALTQTFKERDITLRDQQIGHEAAIS